MEQARDFGWLGPSHPPANILDSLNLYNFSEVQWEVVPFQFPVWFAMVLVVAFSSSLDVLAIEMDRYGRYLGCKFTYFRGSPLDTNHELTMVGMSNIVSGCMGDGEDWVGSFD